LAIKVQVRPNESLEAALRRFKRQCNYGGVFRLAKAKTWHEKRSDKLRRERRERLRTIQRATRIGRLIASGRVQRQRRRPATTSSSPAPQS
jgi:ribosomal protein S21